MRLLLYAAGTPFTPPQTGGNKRFAELAAYLCGRFNADLCCGDADEYLGKLKERAVFRFQKKDSLPLKLLPPEARRLVANRKTVKDIKRQRYDGVITFDVPPTIGLCLFGVKNIILMVRKDLLGYEKTIHPENTVENKVRRSYLWLCEDVCVRKVKEIIVQCEFDKEMLLSRHPRIKNAEKKIKVQINNVNPTWIQEKANVNPAFPPYSGDSVFRISFIGNFNDRRKGHEVFLPAVKDIVEQYDRVCVDVIGAGKELEKFQNMYESDRIRFHGHVDNPLGILKSSNLLVVPSYADSCPNTVMEALYCNIPVIGSNRGGIPEILSNNSIELFELDCDSLRTRITGLLEDQASFEVLQKDEEALRKELTFDWAARIQRMIFDMLGEDT